MKTQLQTFSVKKLTESIKPNNLEDVLSSLKENGYLERYKINGDTVTLVVPKIIEVGVLLKPFEGVLDEDEDDGK